MTKPHLESVPDTESDEPVDDDPDTGEPDEDEEAASSEHDVESNVKGDSKSDGQSAQRKSSSRSSSRSASRTKSRSSSAASSRSRASANGERSARGRSTERVPKLIAWLQKNAQKKPQSYSQMMEANDLRFPDVPMYVCVTLESLGYLERAALPSDGTGRGRAGWKWIGERVQLTTRQGQIWRETKQREKQQQSA